MFRNDKINVPILGIVENMSYFSPPDQPEKRYPIFGEGGCKKLAEELKVPVISQLPIVSAIADSGDAGSPIAADPTTPVALEFTRLAENVAQQVAISNAIRETFGQ
jgi:ATP-binding protein involved in chromosome partitioning